MTNNPSIWTDEYFEESERESAEYRAAHEDWKRRRASGAGPSSGPVFPPMYECPVNAARLAEPWERRTFTEQRQIIIHTYAEKLYRIMLDRNDDPLQARIFLMEQELLSLKKVPFIHEFLEAHCHIHPDDSWRAYKSSLHRAYVNWHGTRQWDDDTWAHRQLTIAEFFKVLREYNPWLSNGSLNKLPCIRGLSVRDRAYNGSEP